MKTNAELLTERKERIRKAVALEKPDRTPLVYMADSFCARHMGVPMADFCSSLKASSKVMLDSTKALGEVDGLDFAFVPAPFFPLGFLTHIKMPGKELPPDSLWQLDERELMTVEDYDTILNKGWRPFEADFLSKRLGIDLPAIMEEVMGIPEMVKNFEEAGYVVYSPLVINLVNEKLSGGRSMPRFIGDLRRCPDKVTAVLDLIQEDVLQEVRQQIKATNSTYVFISPARGASEFFSPKLWERFVWKYLKQIADMIIEEGAVVNFHIDSNWERDLDFFKSFPKGRCVFETDGATDIYKVKEAIGDQMCIKGDVPAGLLALGTPDEVHSYCTRLIKDMGPGFILSAGCTIPANARIENVKAMIAAVN
ncbi:uroporphyrinogen decarboxylase family protein [Holophaga foetida]|uniref:uroporphyrinogen decarboxylase family protein n=1 Tax=Holophaga foetida TaxID=35839 RepID=UPI0002471795|nr:uroporphyrinogen decarboxylase family protein [Holophaga foetida]